MSYELRYCLSSEIFFHFFMDVSNVNSLGRNRQSVPVGEKSGMLTLPYNKVNDSCQSKEQANLLL
jgi:hypothetical protein